MQMMTRKHCHERMQTAGQAAGADDVLTVRACDRCSPLPCVVARIYTFAVHNSTEVSHACQAAHASTHARLRGVPGSLRDARRPGWGQHVLRRVPGAAPALSSSTKKRHMPVLGLR